MKTEKTKILRHYSATCHVCGGKGVLPNDFFEFCGNEFIWFSPMCRRCRYYEACSRGEQRECSICRGNGTVHLYCVEEPTLELLEVPVLVDGKKCFRPGASLRVCWPYNEPPIRREQCKHFVVEE